MVRSWQIRDRTLSNRDHTLVMGVLNVTPNSFSDGGRFLDRRAAIRHGLELWAEGADLVDVGGESTRPGSEGVPAGEELGRVLPVVEALAEEGVVVSIDTTKPEVAGPALEAGAAVVNDVAALGDRAMAGLVAELGAGLVLMHMQGTPRTMQEDPRYDDVVGEVRDFLVARAREAEAAGIPPERICIDPGIGFGKLLEHNLALLAHLGELVDTGYPVLVGTSRKSFIGRILDGARVEEREEGTAATLALAVAAGAAVVRVHDVAAARRVVRVADAIVRASQEGEVRPWGD